MDLPTSQAREKSKTGLPQKSIQVFWFVFITLILEKISLKHINNID